MVARPQRAARWLAAGLFATAITLPSGEARAGKDDVVLVPTVTPIRRGPDAPVSLERPSADSQPRLARWARQLDVIVGEAAQDLGLTLDVSETPASRSGDLSEEALVDQARESWVISPRLSFHAGRLHLRILAVAPGSKVVLVRSQEVAPREVEVRAMVMMRDVVQAGRGVPDEPELRPVPPPDESAVVYHARSQGRAVLALNAAALGGYVGYTIQRASTPEGEDPDPRLTYPLIALGTGVGLGSSMIVADEWDVGLGDAWYLSAGMWWPLASGLLLAESYDVDVDERYVYGLGAAATGMTLATVGLTFRGMSEGGAVLTHSGGAFGLLLGGLTQLMYEGRTDATPSRGMGYGTGAGVLLAGVLATQVEVSPSRVLLIDLGASLGALTGAAAASPLLLVGDEPTEGRDRAWIAAVGAGTLVGAGIGYYTTRPAEHAGATPRQFSLRPFGGVIAASPSPEGQPAPAYGAGVRGTW